MHASVKTNVFLGIDNIPVDFQVNIANGLPTIADLKAEATISWA